jgi:hypothetical protein
MPVGIGFNVKQLRGKFLQKETILTPLQRAQYNGLRSIGAKTRSLARQSMRKGRLAKPTEYPKDLKALLGIKEDSVGGRINQGRNTKGQFAKSADVQPIPRLRSEPGQPPRYYTGLIRKHVYFQADPVTMSVVTGPAALPGIKQTDTLDLLEHGGTRVEEVGEWVLFYVKGRKTVRLANFQTRSVRYEARPFMAPAQDKAVGFLVPQVWEDSLR